MSALLYHRFRARISNAKSREIFSSATRPPCSQRVEGSGCRKFNLIADTIFDWQTAREQRVCLRVRPRTEREKMNGTESVTSRIVRLKRSFSSPSILLSLSLSFYFLWWIYRLFVCGYTQSRKASCGRNGQCPSERHFSFSAWFVDVSRTYAWIFYFSLLHHGDLWDIKNTKRDSKRKEKKERIFMYKNMMWK